MKAGIGMISKLSQLGVKHNVSGFRYANDGIMLHFFPWSE
jgi:triphosphoribosyl-dephospho-CoA synthetase